MIPFFRVFLMALAVLPVGLADAAPEKAGLRVVATISPLHSLASSVMAGVGTPHLLIRPGVSPHDFSLKPSDARAVARADVVLLIGGGLEAGLATSLATLAAQADVVSLMAAEGLRRNPVRRRDGGHDHGHDHDHGAGTPIDPHIWLDPKNGAVLGRAIAEILARRDPANAARYRANAARLAERLRRLDATLAATLAPVKGRTYVVQHDAYGYFEKRYGLAGVGWLAATPQQRPGARSLSALRQRMAGEKVRCLFTEPQVSGGQLKTLAAEMGARVAELDPLGSRQTPGPDAYARTLSAMAQAFADCLGD